MMKPRRPERLLTDIHSAHPKVKYGAGRKLRELAERRPALLVPHLDKFLRLLDEPNKLIQWQAIHVLSHLAGAASDSRFESVFSRYFAPIRGPVMITAANVIKGGARIAAAKPQWADRIAGEFLKVAKAHYRTPECRRIAIGHALSALDGIFHLVRRKPPILHFVRSQLKSARPSTRVKAALFVKRHDH